MRSMHRLALLAAVGLALLPALASAQPPAPKGALVYEDDFSGAAKSGLEDNVNAADYQRGFHPPGVYHLKLENPGEVRWELLPNLSYGQFSAQLDVWDNSDTLQGDALLGFVFRAVDASHLYAVLLDPRRGEYAVRKLDGQAWSDIVPLAASPLVRRQNEVNQLRVDGEGADFTVYLNGETLASFSDPAYAQGGLGLIVANTDAVEPHMHYDNLAVYSAEGAPAASGAALPQTGASAQVPGPALAALALLLLALGALARRAAAPGAST